MENVGELIKKYVELRDHLAQERKKFKELETGIKTDLEVVEMQLLELQNMLGTTSLSSDRGTAYRVDKESYRIGNWDKFIEFVAKTNNWQMLEKRCAKIATKEVLEETSGMAPDEIGIDYVLEHTIQIRRK